MRWTVTSSRSAYPLPALVPITVSIAFAAAISIILSLIGPLWTIATAPSAPSASLLTSLGLHGLGCIAPHVDEHGLVLGKLRQDIEHRLDLVGHVGRHASTLGVRGVVLLLLRLEASEDLVRGFLGRETLRHGLLGKQFPLLTDGRLCDEMHCDDLCESLEEHLSTLDHRQWRDHRPLLVRGRFDELRLEGPCTVVREIAFDSEVEQVEDVVSPLDEDQRIRGLHVWPRRQAVECRCFPGREDGRTSSTTLRDVLDSELTSSRSSSLARSTISVRFVERTSRISSVLMMDLQGPMRSIVSSCDVMIAVSTESRLDGMMM